MTLADAAAEYLKAGWSIIALSGKQPNTRLHPQGLNNAMTGVPETPEDYSLIDTHFNDPETTGIGIVLPENVVVVDIDGEDGAAAWHELVGEAEFVPNTPVARTGHGLHIWYWAPYPINKVAFGPHLDLKGFGGYVAVPPSKHPDGAIYEWLDPLTPQMDLLPGGVTRELERRARIVASMEPLVAAGGWYTPVLDADTKTIVHRHPEGVLRSVHEAEVGNRNSALFWAACTAAAAGVPMKDVMKVLQDASTLPRTESKTAIQSAYRKART